MHKNYDSENVGVEDAEKKTMQGIIKQCKSALIFALLLTFAVEMLSIVPVLYLLNGYDRVLSSKSEITLVSLTIMVVGVYIFWTAIEWIRRRMLLRISLRMDWELALKVFDVSFRRHVGKRRTNVHQVMNDLVLLRQFMTGKGMTAMMAAPFSVFFIFISYFFHPYLAIFSIATAVILLAVTYLTQKVSSPILKAANNASAEANRLAAQNLRQSEVALALGMHGHIRKRWYERHQDSLKMQVYASEAAASLGTLSNFLGHSLPTLQMGLGFYLAINDAITGGMVIAASFLLRMAIKPFRQLMSSWKDITNARQSYERLQILFNEDDARHTWMELPPPTGHISVSELAVQPIGASRPILTDIHFSLNPGEITAIVGPSASGKSSVVKSLVGIWKPSYGSVRLDGAEVWEWAQHTLGQYVGYVPQDCEFFEATVAENIARMGPIEPGKVTKAAMEADVHELILSLPLGYDTLLGENGHVLTGGQRQRIAIARALYDDPCLVVMDEPNASLDEAGEQALIQAIYAMKHAGTTVVFTTHRSELVRIADNLLVLRNGKQVGFGSVADMLKVARKIRDASKRPAPADTASSGQGGARDIKGAAA
jgi:PrtD family type I secretion system ABC transporter